MEEAFDHLSQILLLIFSPLFFNQDSLSSPKEGLLPDANKGSHSVFFMLSGLVYGKEVIFLFCSITHR